MFTPLYFLLSSTVPIIYSTWLGSCILSPVRNIFLRASDTWMRGGVRSCWLRKQLCECSREIYILKFSNNTYPSSSRPESVSLWHAHSRRVVFHNLHRGQRETIIFHLINYRSLRVLTAVAPSRESSFTSPPSLVSPIPFCRCRFRFPLPRQIKSCLFPLPHP